MNRRITIRAAAGVASTSKGKSLQSKELVLLSNNEQQALSRCESIIEKHLKAFYDAGRALLEIRDNLLYRAEFRTFEEYCRQRWDISRIHAHRLVKATEVIETVLLPMGNISMPDNERQVRPLVGMQKEEAQRVWKAATESANGGKVTGSHVSNAKKAAEIDRDEASSPGRESWQDLVEPLLVETLEALARGDRDRVEDLLLKAELHLQIGKNRGPVGI